MKVSLNWIRSVNNRYGSAADPAPKGVDALVEKIGLQLGAVEEVVDLGKKYQGILIVKVVSCVKHPNADKLSLCMVDTGKGQPIQVVCGAPNVKTGMLAAWIPPGNTVPSTLDKEPFVLEAREIRGKLSNGMLASAKELDLGDDHTGIVEVDEGKPGDDFAKTYHLDDYIIDIENKMFTHRPDCFGQLGVAREIAGIQGHKFKSPPWYREDAQIEKSRARDDHKLSLNNKIPKLVPRFTLVVIKDVSVGPSPLWLRTKLSAVGVKPINNIVDLTNFFMVDTAQPLHAYDYEKLLALQKDKKTGVKMAVRLSKKGEELKLLGGKMLKLDVGAALITTGDIPIGLGGVMGGADTEVDENTKNIILECANFDMNQTRKTAMRYGLFTDAATRFTKGQSPRQNLAVIAKAANDITKIAGGRVSSVIDEKHLPPAPKQVEVGIKFIEERLGENLGAAKIKQLLENVEFEAKADGDKLSIKAPFWRTDIEIPEDIVEEVGRLYGYEHLPQVLPVRNLSPALANPAVEFKDKIRDLLSAAGANELLTYSFVHGRLLEQTGQDKKLAFKIANALSPDLQYYRLSLAPSLLEKVHPNIKAGYDIFSLFEIGTAHQLRQLNKERLPEEFQRLAFVITSKASDPAAGAPFFQAKFYVEYLTEKLGLPNLSFTPLSVAKLGASWSQAQEAFEPDRSAAVFAGSDFIGLVGEPSQNLSVALKLPANTAQFELDINAVLKLGVKIDAYQPLAKFPTLDQDLTLKLPIKISYAAATDYIYSFLDSASASHGYKGALRPLDIYQKPSDTAHHQITWRIILSHPERTLTTQEINKLLDELSAKIRVELQAERV